LKKENLRGIDEKVNVKEY